MASDPGALRVRSALRVPPLIGSSHALVYITTSVSSPSVPFIFSLAPFADAFSPAGRMPAPLLVHPLAGVLVGLRVRVVIVKWPVCTSNGFVCVCVVLPRGEDAFALGHHVADGLIVLRGPTSSCQPVL